MSRMGPRSRHAGPMRLIEFLVAVCLCSIVASCQAPSQADGEPPVWSVQLEAEESVAILDAALTVTGELVPLGGQGVPEQPLPIRMRLDSDAIICGTRVSESTIHLMTYERKGEQDAYGVYGLAREKDKLVLDYPLAGDPINWEERDSRQALMYLLGLDGVSAADSKRLVERHDWLAEGLRVLFNAPHDAAKDLLEGTPARLLVIRVEIPSGVRPL